MKNIALGFWAYSALMAITILNDRLSIFNLLFSGVYILICMFYAIRVLGKSRASMYMILFPLIYIVYAAISPDIIGSMNSKWGMLNWTLKVTLTFFPAYYFGRKGVVDLKQLRILGICLLAVGVFSYYLNINLVLLDQEYDEEGITNNVGYLFVAILPILFVNVRKNIVFIILAYIFVLVSMKRGAIVCAIATIPFLVYLSKRQFHISRIVILFGLVIATFTLYYTIKRAAKENAYVEHRIEATVEGNASGRDDYALRIIDELKRYEVTELFFGKGINYSYKVLGNFAHNDWLEIMLSMGIVGCLCYFLSFWGMFIYCKKECFHGFRAIGYMIIMIALLRTVLSMNFFSLDSIPLYYSLGLICKKKNICLS